ncbi:MAG: hypothetical protein L6Q84_00170 [Polyangiaceae bacterium]|nr:hypothetical protein [Polyangiaceae bacterium]
MERASFGQVLLAVALVPLMLLPIWVSTCSPTPATVSDSAQSNSRLTAGR